MNFRSILFFFFLSGNLLYGQDSTSILSRVHKDLLPVNNFSEKIFFNPANQYYRREHSLSEFGVTYDNLSKKTNIQQTGNGVNQFLIHAQSYYKIDTSNTVWGNAHYKNGLRKNVKWNEGSDYNSIYPYVTADSIGGNLSFEEYFFKGGYSKTFRKMTFGIVIEYRALMEYRDFDPRPKNTVSDLKGSVGISRNTSENYAIATAVELQKYTQSNTLKFFSELGAPAVYHMTGLGTYSNLLTGDKLNTYYDGGSYGANIQWFPKNRKGFTLCASYNHFDYEKIMTDFQNLIASSVAEEKYSIELSYLKKNNPASWGIKMNFYFKDREGTENKFDNQTSSSYIKISEDIKYRNQITSFTFSGLYAVSNPNLSWSATPGFRLKNTSEKYLDPIQSLDVDQGIATLDLSLSKFYSNSVLHFSTSIEYAIIIDSDIKLNGTIQSNSIFEMLNNNYVYLSSSYTKLNLSSRWDYHYSSELNVFIKGNIDYFSYSKNHNNTFFQITLGLTL